MTTLQIDGSAAIGVAMTVLKNGKHEAFAKLVAAGKGAGASYAIAQRGEGAVPTESDRVGSSKWLHNVTVADRIKELKEASSRQAEYSIADMLADQITIAKTDRRELFDVRFGACRYCHGDGHQFHWKEREYLEAVQRAEADGTPLPDIGGGFGYMRTAEPNPECPDCEGEGREIVRLKDTRHLSPAAAMIYDGVKETKQGVEIKTKDSMKAWDNIGKILGAFLTRQEMSGPGGAPMQMDLSALSEEQLRVLASIAVNG